MMNVRKPTDPAPDGTVSRTKPPSKLRARRKRTRIGWLLVVPLAGVAAYAIHSAIQTRFARLAHEIEHGALTKRPRVFSKLHYEGDLAFLWARGPKVFEDEQSEWFDMTGAPLPLEKVNHGIGRDTIPAIDDPVFVDADDPVLRRKWGGSEDADIDWLKVIGYAHNGVARAYPIRLLNRHELVNDTVGGKPVTVGW